MSDTEILILAICAIFMTIGVCAVVEMIWNFINRKRKQKHCAEMVKHLKLKRNQSNTFNECLRYGEECETK